jgi:quinol monooxygenase YgiN
MGIVRLTGQLICTTPADAAIVRAYLPTHIALSRAEPGCLSFNVQQTDDPLVWHLDESFADQAAFDAHQARTRASEWYQKTAHIRRAFAVTID